MRNPFSRKSKVYVVMMGNAVWGVFSSLESTMTVLTEWAQRLESIESIPQATIYEVDYRLDRQYVRYRRQHRVAAMDR